MNLLIVEDSPTDALLAQNSLAEDLSFHTTTARTLAEATTKLKEKPFDVVLLDLGLPDSQGMDTLHHICSLCGADTAIVVLTGNEDRALGALALRAGAQDYLYKSHVNNPEALRRCAIYAHERRRHMSKLNALERQLDLARKEERCNQETAFWSELARSSRMDMSGDATGNDSALRERHPQAFDLLVQRYGEIIEQGVEQRVRKIEADTSHASALLAWRLGDLRATPRDVVVIHILALRQKMDDAPSLVRAMACQEEARLRIVELMGHLATYYRWNAMPPSNK